MDGADAQYRQNEVVAGPSTVMQQGLFSPPTPTYSQPRTFLTSTQDLLARFHLHPAYNKYVRPSSPTHQLPVPPLSAVAPNAILHDPPPEAEEKKKKNSYRHLIKNIPGKHSMKKDDYLTTMMQVPPKQRIAIVEFDARTQAEAFTVSAEGLKGWNPGALVLESAQAREDRKKRKELRRLARAQAQGPTPGAIPSTPGIAPPPQPTPPNTTTPSAQQPPGAFPPKPRIPTVTIPPASSGNRTGTTPTPTSASPRSAAPMNVSPPWTVNSAMRGKKRELEDGTVQAVSSNPNLTSPTVPIGIVGARPGGGTFKPRPVKKQRTDIHGQSREIPVQQPTPQPT
ncbi:hypothetical protein ID866_6737 [Astraeus odoratus]|nr:hypothetical protein ID866_6737 [Astraeus odoratus]